ncbi:MAG TPA: cytochrome c oxidase subunit 3 family protein [Thermoanaerobaculia bacterium]|nr:cytochrome c oxidase subunit 3 family protein [Thermoanaerobaculia bacterium]
MPDAAHAHGHAHGHPALQHQFDTLEQQKESSTFGMWVFLVTEIMFFGGLFTIYMIYRMASYEGFAEASHELDIVLGSINTAVLIGSSLTMAMAVWAAQTGRARTTANFLVATIVLGSVFLGIKVVEYAEKFHHDHVPGWGFAWEGPHADAAELFYSLYFAMTGLHAVHMIIGIGVLAALIRPALRGRYDASYYNPVEITGLYWHFVDIVWIFLFPLLYLIGRHVT